MTDPSYSGCTIFPFAGRIRNAVFRGIPLEKNDGKNSLHGGSSSRRASFRRIHSSPSSVTYRTKRNSGEDGLCGDRVYSVTYSLENDTLLIVHEMTSSSPVLTDTTCHLYFNLDGDETVLRHTLSLEETAIVLNAGDHTAERIMDTEKTAFDITHPVRLSTLSCLPSFSFSHGINNAYVLAGNGRLRLEGRDIALSAESSASSVVLYSGGYLENTNSHLAVEFEDIPTEDARTVSDRYRREFAFTFHRK